MWYDLTQAANDTPLTHIAIDERVVAYGDGFFTTMAVRAGKIAWQDFHQQRIVASCQALILTLPITVTAVMAMLREHATGLDNGILKLIICRKTQPMRGYGFSNGEANIWLNVIANSQTPDSLMPDNLNPDNLTSSNLSLLSDTFLTNISHPPSHPSIMRQDFAEIPIQPVANAICLKQKIACLPQPLAGLKLLNAQDKVLASRELVVAQTQHTQPLPLIEGLVQNVREEWVEGTFCNIFYQLTTTKATATSPWFTPPITDSGVNGVMRQVLLQRFAVTGQAVQVRALSDDDLPKLSGVFFCNAVRGIMPIRELVLLTGEVLRFF